MMKRFFVAVLICSVLAIAAIVGINILEQPSADKQPAQQQPALTANDTDPSQGPRDAKVTVMQFGSFNCPACKTAATQMDQLRALFPEQVRIVWKDLPEETGFPYQAAIAARCAQQQGKFWQYHDLLYEKQDLIASRALYTVWAKDLGILTERFDTCLDKENTKPLVDENITEALQNGVTVVPYVKIGDATYEGPQTLAVYRAAVDAVLANK